MFHGDHELGRKPAVCHQYQSDHSFNSLTQLAVFGAPRTFLDRVARL
jgi:hypothetical protein